MGFLRFRYSPDRVFIRVCLARSASPPSWGFAPPPQQGSALHPPGGPDPLDSHYWRCALCFFSSLFLLPPIYFLCITITPGMTARKLLRLRYGRPFLGSPLTLVSMEAVPLIAPPTFFSLLPQIVLCIPPDVSRHLPDARLLYPFPLERMTVSDDPKRDFSVPASLLSAFYHPLFRPE